MGVSTVKLKDRDRIQSKKTGILAVQIHDVFRDGRAFIIKTIRIIIQRFFRCKGFFRWAAASANTGTGADRHRTVGDPHGIF